VTDEAPDVPKCRAPVHAGDARMFVAPSNGEARAVVVHVHREDGSCAVQYTMPTEVARALARSLCEHAYLADFFDVMLDAPRSPDETH
jgi:hypothetical protein